MILPLLLFSSIFDQSSLCWRIYYQNKIHSSCEIEGFVETNLCKLCVKLRSHVLLCVLIKDIGWRLPLESQCSLYQGQQGDVNQAVRGNYKTRFGGRSLTAVEGMHQFIMYIL